MKKASAPTASELLRLPRWACIAFAARCARRVQPLLSGELPDVGVRAVQAVERAIRLAEEVAERAAPYEPDRTIIRLHAAFVACEKLAARVLAESDIAAAVARTAAAVAKAAEGATCGFGPAKDDRAAANGAAEACAAALTADPKGLTAVRKDWKLLAAAARANGWTRTTPVPVTFFGGERPA